VFSVLSVFSVVSVFSALSLLLGILLELFSAGIGGAVSTRVVWAMAFDNSEKFGGDRDRDEDIDGGDRDLTGEGDCSC